MGKSGRPPRTACRFCGHGGELLQGAHRGCLYAYQTKQKMAKRGANTCKICGVAIGHRRRYCDQHRDERRAEYMRDKERRRGYRRRSLKPRVPKAPKPKAIKPPKKATPKARADFNRERPLAEPTRKVRPLEGVIITPPHVTVTRVPAQGAAALSLREYRRIG